MFLLEDGWTYQVLFQVYVFAKELQRYHIEKKKQNKIIDCQVMWKIYLWYISYQIYYTLKLYRLTKKELTFDKASNNLPIVFLFEYF